MKLIKADESHQSLLQSVHRSRFDLNGLETKSDFQQDFFKPYQMLSNDSCTYVLVDDSNVVQAAATMQFLPGKFGTTEQTIGYATDLYVALNRKAIFSWSDTLIPAMEEERKNRGVKIVLSSIMDRQRLAYNALVRPREGRRKMPRYFLLKRFEKTTIHGFWPLARGPLPSLQYRQAEEHEVIEFLKFRQQFSDPKGWGLNLDAQHCYDMLLSWSGFSLRNLWLAFNKSGDIVGGTLLVPQNYLTELTVKNYSERYRILSDSLPLISWTGMAKKLPKENKNLEAVWACWTAAKNPDVFLSVMQTAWRQLKGRQFLAFTRYEDEFKRSLPKTWINLKTRGGLYVLQSPDEPTPNLLELTQNFDSSGFEAPFYF